MDANLSAYHLQQPFLCALFTDSIRVFLPNFTSYLLARDHLSSQYVHGEKLEESLVSYSTPQSVYFSTDAKSYFSSLFFLFLLLYK